MADQISDVSVTNCSNSRYVAPFRMHYKQDGVSKTWDYVKGHDSVAILLYNKDRDVFPVVKQFRPAVYAAKVKAFTDGQSIDTTEHKGELGMTLELCAGIVDKDVDVSEIAQAEILEETGYKVPRENIQKVTSFRTGVGIKATLMTLFYAEVSDDMRGNAGGGLVEEGEMIDVFDLPAKHALKYMMDENITKPSGMMFAFTWYFFMKDKEKCEINLVI